MQALDLLYYQLYKSSIFLLKNSPQGSYQSKDIPKVIFKASYLSEKARHILNKQTKQTNKIIMDVIILKKLCSPDHLLWCCWAKEGLALDHCPVILSLVSSSYMQFSCLIESCGSSIPLSIPRVGGKRSANKLICIFA